MSERGDRSDRSVGATTDGRGTPVPVSVTDRARTLRPVSLLLAGPVLWSLHFLVVYLVAEAGCTGEGPGLRALAPPVPVAVTLVATVVAALACLAAAALAHRRWRERRSEPGGGHGVEPVDRGGSLAFAGLLLSLLGLVQVLFTGIPALVLPAC